jgi:hypothetical protein
MYLITYSLFNDAVSSSEYRPMAPNDRTINKLIQKKWKKMVVAQFYVLAWFLL